MGTLQLIERAEKLVRGMRKPARKDAVRIKELLPWSRRYFPHRFTVEPSLLHQELAVDLDRIVVQRGAKICRIAPRGSAKSTLETLSDALKNALEGTEMYQIIISDVQTNANKFLKDIKDEVETNDELKKDYPESCGVGPVWQQEAIEFPNGARIESLGKGGKIRGRRHRQYRPTRIILDDTQSFDDSYSEVQMEKDFHWLMSDVMSAGSPDTNFVVLGTALADMCIVCKLEQTPGWDHKRYKQLLVEPTNMGIWQKWKEMLWRNDDPKRDENALNWYLENKAEMDLGATVLWPERFPLFDVMRKRYSEGERAFQCEQQGIPMPPGDAEWPMEYFDYANFWFDEWPQQMSVQTMALDPSKGKSDKQGDYQAFVRLGRTGDKQLWCEAWLEKMDTKCMCDFLVDLYRQNPCDMIALEENGFQELINIPLEQSCRQFAITLPIQPIVNTVAKPVRIRRLTPYLAKRQIRFRRTPGTMMLVDQLKKYRVPPIGHDDGCLIAGTMIDTARGIVPIEDVTMDDMVLTRKGYRKVKMHGCTGTKQTYKITLSNGSSITGTGNHPIMANNRWTRIDRVMVSDKITLCSKPKASQKKSSTKVSHSGDTLKQNNGRTECTISHIAGGLQRAFGRFIRKYGKTLMARFQKAMRYTTRTGIRSITPLITSNALRPANMPNAMQRASVEYAQTSKNYHWKRREMPLLHGTSLMMAESGTENTPKSYGKTSNLRKSNALCAENNTIHHSPSVLNTARHFAGVDCTSKSEGGGLSANVQYVDQITNITKTGRPQLAAIDVVTCSMEGMAKVYNLSIAEEPEYFANGMLVHNCDAAEMALRIMIDLFNAKYHPR